jgi:hypothetical protein
MSTIHAATPQNKTSPPAPANTDTPQDSVQLSATAQRAMGDVDHDGDSH